MGFLKRILGAGNQPPEGARYGDAEDVATAGDAEQARDREQARDLELALGEAHRLDDDLIQRQLRYADRSWTPPAEGGTRRADDEEAAKEAGGDA